MNQKEMIEDLVKMLDNDMINGVGHINIGFDSTSTIAKEVKKSGCTDCSKIPLACSTPTLHEGLDD